MGVFGKIMDSLRLSDNEDDDYFLDDDYEDEKPEMIMVMLSRMSQCPSQDF